MDLLSSFYFHHIYKEVRKFIFCKKINNLPHEASKICSTYDLIVCAGDFELKIIKDSNLTNSLKLKLLPVTQTQFFNHLCSKIELSKILKKNQIVSPAFKIVNKYENIDSLAKELGYPVILKIDYSGGGAGIFKLNTSHDIRLIPNYFKREKLLLQKFIDGKIFDFSGFYQKGKLIHFSCSEFIGSNRDPFGPSILRRFDKNISSDKNIIQELSTIGHALGLNGFTNVCCVKSKLDAKRYYFEVDVRPNDWVNYPRYFGDDPALHIKNHFDKKDLFKPLMAIHKNQQGINLFANPSRLNFYELIINKYHWMTYSSFYSVAMHKFSFFVFNPIEKFKIFSVRHIKPYISIRLWKKLKQLALNFSF